MAGIPTFHIVLPLPRISQGSAPLLRLATGEIVSARVLDVRPEGVLLLALRGTEVAARTGLSFARGETLNLRVVGGDRLSGEVRLQLISVQGDIGRPGAAPLPDRADTANIVKNFTALVSRLGAQAFRETSASEGAAKTHSALAYDQVRSLRQALESLLRVFPDEPASLPGGVRTALRHSLAESLRMLGPAIHTRHAQMSETLRGSSDLGQLAPELLIEESRIGDGRSLFGAIKRALSETGVGFEAKLKTLAGKAGEGQTVARQGGSSEGPGQESALRDGGGVSRQGMGRPEVAMAVEKDLKAQLLMLRERLGAREAAAGPDMLGRRENALLVSAERQLAGIETFQALSRLHDSFHTFLPLQWRELRDGDILFKRRREVSGDTFYCIVRLDLEETGIVKVVVASVERKLSVDIYVSNAAFRCLVRSHVDEVVQGLRGQGVTLERLTVSESVPGGLKEDDTMGSVISQINLTV